MAARGGKHATERPAQIKTKRAKLNGNKTPQTGRKTKTVTFTPKNKEARGNSETNIISVPPPVSPKFDKEPHYALLKELFTQIFSTPRCLLKSQPLVDHVLSFTVADSRIWFRRSAPLWRPSLERCSERLALLSPQIMEEDASLVEIGPRFVLNLIRIFQGSFGGPTLYESPHFEPPNTRRRMIRQKEKRREQQEVFWTPAEPTDTQKQLRLTQMKKRTQMKRKGLP